jgi:hypothetical protein
MPLQTQRNSNSKICINNLVFHPEWASGLTSAIFSSGLMWRSGFSDPMFWRMMAGNFRLSISGTYSEALWTTKYGDMKISMLLSVLIIHFKFSIG